MEKLRSSKSIPEQFRSSKPIAEQHTGWNSLTGGPLGLRSAPDPHLYHMNHLISTILYQVTMYILILLVGSWF